MHISWRRSRGGLFGIPALVLGVLLPVVVGDASAAPAASPSPGGGPPPKLELVLDLSGSMKENDAGGQTRLAAAKQAVTRILDAAPPDIPLGLRVYGATYPGQDKAQGCEDTQQLLPVATMDATARADARQKVAGLAAVGFTPIGIALRAASADLGTEGKRRIVLVSDGEDTCAPPPPCDVAKELKAQGVDLTIDAVGFKTTGAARDQLRCIAQVSGGSYADAGTADALVANLGTVFRRAWTTYPATGTPVTGSLNGCADAPLVQPGRHLDQFVDARSRFYRVVKRPDQLLQVSATAVLTHPVANEFPSIEVAAGPTTTGTEPSGWLRGADFISGWSNIVTTGARSLPPGVFESRPPNDEGCVKVGNGVLGAGEAPVPVEVLIGVADADPTRAAPPAPAPAPRSGADAAGGFSFNSATPVGAGTHRQSIAVGEFLFWRVDVKAGQTFGVTGAVDVPGDLPTKLGTGLVLDVYDANRKESSCATSGSGSSEAELLDGRTGRIERVCGPWTVRRPEGQFQPPGYSIPGTYYLRLALADAPETANGAIVPVELTVRVDGTPAPGADPGFDFGADSAAVPPASPASPPAQSPAPAPEPSGPQSTSPTTAADASDDDSLLDTLALPLGIAAGVALLGGIAYFVVRRRQRPSP